MADYQIQLTTQDGQNLEFDCQQGEDLVSAAERANIYLAAQCRSGSCGACSGRCQSGEYEMGEHGADALPTNAAETQQVLMCCTYPQSDMQLQLPYDYSLVRFEEIPTRQADIVAKTYLTPDTVKLELQLLPDEDDNLSLDFQPGQFMEIAIPGLETKRAYSLANAPNWDGSLEFLIKLRPQGQFSTFLDQQATAEMSLELRGPLGTFTLQDRGLRPRYFVAGGCGLASVMSMLRQMAEWQEPHSVQLFFGVWKEEELFYQQELADLAAEYPNLQYTLCVTEPTPSWQGFHGSPVSALEAALQEAPETPDIYICGSPGLIEGVAAIAAQHNIPRDQLVYEHYQSSAPAAESGRCEIA